MTLSNEYSDTLGRELAFFHANKQDWLLTHANEFVVISGENVAGFYPDFVTAFKAGIRPLVSRERSYTFLVNSVIR